MCDLPQAGQIANYYRTKHLAPHGYHQCRHTDVLWKHKWRPSASSLVVDYFGIKYIGKQNSDHIIESIIKYYPVNVDCTGGLYCIIKLECTYYPTRSIDLSIPKYAPNELHEFQHPYPKRPQMNYTNRNAQTM